MPKEPKKPDFIPNMSFMNHVPEPSPENYWWLRLDDPRIVMVDTDRVTGKLEPVLTLTVREIKEIDGKKLVGLQITASQRMQRFYK